MMMASSGAHEVAAPLLADLADDISRRGVVKIEHGVGVVAPDGQVLDLTCGDAELVRDLRLARFSSSRVMAWNCAFGMSGAEWHAINALVLQGLPTTSTLTLVFALSFNALPCPVKMGPLTLMSSARSMSLLRGREPTRKAASASLNATLASSEISIP